MYRHRTLRVDALQVHRGIERTQHWQAVTSRRARAQVAAQRTGGANLRRTHRARSLGESRNDVAQRCAFHLGIGHTCADAHGLGIAGNIIVNMPTAQLVHLAKRDHIVDRRAIEIDLDHEVGAALHEARTGVVAQRLHRFAQ